MLGIVLQRATDHHHVAGMHLGRHPLVPGTYPAHIAAALRHGQRQSDCGRSALLHVPCMLCVVRITCMQRHESPTTGHNLLLILPSPPAAAAAAAAAAAPVAGCWLLLLLLQLLLYSCC
jgi:hypothetical protein